MALVTVASDAGLDATSGAVNPQLAGDYYAGEALFACAVVQLKSDGKIWLANGSAADANAMIVGMVPRDYQVGEPVTVFTAGAQFRYAASGLVMGAKLYLGTTAGRLDTAATTGDLVTNGTAQAISATDIRLIKFS